MGASAIDVAIAHHQAGRLAQAKKIYSQILQNDPQDADALHLLGLVFHQLGEHKAAIDYIQRAIAIRPNAATFHANLGAVYQAVGDFRRAVASCQGAVQLNPRDSRAYFNLGGAHQTLGKLDQAVTNYRCTIRINPEFRDAHRHLGSTLRKQGQIKGAEVSYRRVLELEPDWALGPLHIARLHPTVFRNSEEMSQYRRQLLSVIERVSPVAERLDLSRFEDWAVHPPLDLQFDADNLRTVKEAYAAIFRDFFPKPSRTVRDGLPRIGIIVTDRHAGVFLKALAGVLRHLKSDVFETVVFGSPRETELLRAGLKAPHVRIFSIPKRIDWAVEAIRSAACDVLYHWEVGTDEINYFLPFFGLAPHQCTSHGVQVTSGIPQIDSYLSSELVEPEGAVNHYSETLVLAKTLLTYRYRAVLPASPKTRRDFGLQAHRHIYLCAQQLGKFHPDFDSVLANILRRDTLGIIVVPEDRHGYVAKRLRDRFTETIPDVADRIVFLPRQTRPDYLSLTVVADVILDPPHFSGVNTTYDAFSFGKPVVTMASAFRRGRYTYGCYKKMGMSEFVAADVDDYSDIAVRLGTDAEYRAGISEQIQTASSVLFEDIEAVREHERIFLELLQKARSDNSQ